MIVPQAAYASNSVGVAAPEYAQDYTQASAARDLRVSGERLRCMLLWLTGASGAIVFIEPSPYEISSFLSLIMFVIGGLTLSATLMPLVVLLVLINIGYSLSGATVIGEDGVTVWLITSWYLGLTAIFFAAMLGQNTEARLRAITAGVVVGGLIASFAAIVGYSRVIGSLNELLLLYDRARGTFKDPNVLGAFLVFPALLCLLMVVSSRFGRALRGAMLFGFIGIAVLLSFSRAAWGQLAYTAVVMLGLIFLTTRSPPQRLRIVLLILAGSVVLAAAIAALLSIDAIAKLFVERASFSQSYDMGAQGRFARHFPRRRDGARLSGRHRPAAIQQVLPRGPAQLLPQRLHGGRLARRRELSGAGVPDARFRAAHRVHPHAVPADHDRGVRRLFRGGDRELHHRHPVILRCERSEPRRMNGPDCCAVGGRRPSRLVRFAHSHLSDCVSGQALCHLLLSLSMAFRMVRSFRATAIRATFLGFPAASRRS